MIKKFANLLEVLTIMKSILFGYSYIDIFRFDIEGTARDTRINDNMSSQDSTYATLQDRYR